MKEYLCWDEDGPEDKYEIVAFDAQAAAERYLERLDQFDGTTSTGRHTIVVRHPEGDESRWEVEAEASVTYTAYEAR